MIFFRSNVLSSTTSFLILIFLQISKSEKILCISRPEEDHSIDRKYQSEYVPIKHTLFSSILVSAFVFSTYCQNIFYDIIYPIEFLCKFSPQKNYKKNFVRICYVILTISQNYRSFSKYVAKIRSLSITSMKIKTTNYILSFINDSSVFSLKRCGNMHNHIQILSLINYCMEIQMFLGINIVGNVQILFRYTISRSRRNRKKWQLWSSVSVDSIKTNSDVFKKLARY